MTPLPFSHVATKLHIPATRPSLLSRPRLVAHVSRCAQRKLLLVLAPAGFGKTTALCEWSQESKWPVAWVSLDEMDNDPIRFWSYLIAALDKLEPRIGQHVLPFIHTPRPSPTEYLIPTLINTVDLIPGDFALVLDDYHCVESEAIHDALAYLIDYAPSNMHLVIASRTEPPLPLARWRARGQLAELRAVDLCFSKEETRRLLDQVLALDVPAETIEMFQTQTEGWIAGLQLAALALREQAPHARALDQAPQGDRQYIAGYLSSEVLSQQPEETQTFLLQTAILDTLSAPLCNAVTGRTDSQAVLKQLHQSNLFITALDRKGQYRYHHLFADFLRDRLTSTTPQDVGTLHLCAADWHREQGDSTRAIRHYLAAGHTEKATELVEATAREHLMQGELKTLLNWFDALPDDTIRGRPLFCLVYGWVLTHAGLVDRATQYLDHLDAHVADAQQASLLLGESAAVRARLAVIRGDNTAMIRFSEQALALLPSDAVTPRSDAMLDLAFAYGANGDPQAALDALGQALELSHQAGNLRTAMLSLYYLGDLCIALGQHQRAARLYQQGLQWCQQSTPPSEQSCWAHAGLGALLYEWDDLDSALDHLQRAVRLAKQAGEVKVLMYPRIHLARAHQTAGRTEEALATLQTAAEIAQQTQIVDIENQIHVARIQVWVRAGQLDAAANWLQSHGIGLRGDTLCDHEVTMLAWFHLAADRDQTALARVAEQAQAQCDEQYPLSLAQNLALLARAHQAMGQQEQAVADITRSLSLAEPMGLVRTFVDHGEPMKELLKAVASQHAAADGHGAAVSDAYVARLLEAFETARLAARLTSLWPETPAPETPFEPLRPREIEVLQHVAVGRSNSEIADEMVMAVSTIKWYLRNIYGKLQVRRRTQAVARARELNLI